MTRDELYALIADHVTVTDEWGGEKIANWKYGFNLCVAGIDEATDAILAKLENPFGEYGDPETSEYCEFCAGDNDCPSKWDGWLCSRSIGHAGKHVACAGRGSHSAETWGSAKQP